MSPTLLLVGGYVTRVYPTHLKTPVVCTHVSQDQGANGTFVTYTRRAVVGEPDPLHIGQGDDEVSPTAQDAAIQTTAAIWRAAICAPPVVGL